MNPYEKLKAFERWAAGPKKTAFLSALIIGGFAHILLLVHGMISPDGLYNSVLYSAGPWEASLGRWGINYVDSLRMDRAPQVLVEITCILLAAVAAFLVAAVFDFKHHISAILTAAVIQLSPALASTMLYQYTADAYVLSFVFAVLAALIMTKSSLKNRMITITSILSSAVLCTFSLAMYQNYFGIFVGFCIAYDLFLLLFRDDLPVKKVLIRLLFQVLSAVIALGLYFVISKAEQSRFQVGTANYQGSDQVGVIHSLFSLPQSIAGSYKAMAKYYLGDSIVYNRAWHRPLIFLIFFAAVLAVAVVLLLKKKYHRTPKRFILILVLTFLLVPGLNLILMMVPGCQLYSLNSMQMAMLLPVLFSFLEQAEVGKWNAIRTAALVTASVLMFTWFASTEFSWQYMSQTFRQAEAVSERIIDRVESTEGYNKDMPVLLAGIVDENLYSRDNAYVDHTWGELFLTPVSHGTLQISQESWRKFLLGYLGMNLNFCTPPQQEAVVSSERFQQMGVWPAADSVAVIDGIMVVKLNPDPPR